MGNSGDANSFTLFGPSLFLYGVLSEQDAIMTLLEDYRRGIYGAEERKRKLPVIAGTTRPISRTTATAADSPSSHEPAQTIERLQRKPSGKKLKPSGRSVKLTTLPDQKQQEPAFEPSSATATAIVGKSKQLASSSNRLVNEASNQLENERTSAPLVRRESVFDRVALLASSADHGARTLAFQTPAELPPEFVHCAHVHISKWTTIVSDKTLFRIAARNHRINQCKQKELLVSIGGGARPTHSELPDPNEPTRSIVMNGAEAITDTGLHAVALNVPSLEVLEMANAIRISDAGLRDLALNCHVLARLNISSCRSIRGAGLGAICDHCRRLTELNLADCSHMSEWVIMRCMYAFTLLEHLNVARCFQITDNLLKTLANECRHLRSINLSDCTQVSDSGVVNIALKCHQLEKIALNRVQNSERITDTACAALGEHCPRLDDVNLAGCNFLTDAGIKWIAHGCPLLQTLDISNVFHVTDAALRELSGNCSRLRSLKLVNVKNVSDVGLRFLATGCKRLVLLHVNNLYLVSDGSNRDFGLEGLQAIAKGCTELKDLNLSGCFQLVERALVALGASCHALKRINLKACPKITLFAVNALLHGCPNLTSLNLSGILLCNNAMLAAIGAHCPQLKELFIAQCDKVSDSGLRHLASRADQFEVLDLSGCVLISDIGMSALLDRFQNPALVHLYLVGCNLITQDSIARLAFSCPLLLTLSVHGCRVSARVLQSLSSSWPFAVLRVPSSAAVSSSASEFGIFPMHRAKDRRYVEETYAFWIAAIKIQNLFRARKARAAAVIQREMAMQVYVAKRLQSMWRGRKARRVALIKKLMQSGLEKSAIKIQRLYRATRQKRKAHRQMNAIFEKQLEHFAVFVQRKYRAKRAAGIAKAIVRAERKRRDREIRAAIQLQRRYRGLAGRRRFNLTKIQKQAREREEQQASLRIQVIYRGRADRKKAQELRLQKQRELELMHRRATQLQAQFRRRRARKEADRRREEIRQRERAATKLQTLFRARKDRLMVDMMRMTNLQRECHQAAYVIQKRYRGRKDRIGLALLIEIRRLRAEHQLQAAVHIQRSFRRYMLRRLARMVMLELLQLRQNDLDMEAWAATLVQAHWRRQVAKRELKRIQVEKCTRWKQLIDTYNEHGRGYGAPFYYNQLNAEIRWRMPRELLVLTARPKCDQCESPESAAIECATCCEYFCSECNKVIHGRGKRRMHVRRELFNFYGIRRDYGDGEFPSVWPSEINQDRERGYDFIAMKPTDGYQSMVWRIAQFVPVTTGILAEDNNNSNPPGNNEPETQEALVSFEKAVNDKHGTLGHEDDFDECGNSLWEPFYDFGRQEYRYYHRITKRVVSS